MISEHYPFNTFESFNYEFYSEGQNRKIRKVVRFTKLQSTNGEWYYNLGFGDWSDSINDIDDFNISGNKDEDKVLRTIAAIVLDFVSTHSDAVIFATGSTISRTRLYRMRISRFLNQIEANFEVFGLRNENDWESFEIGKDYRGFLIRKK